MNIRITRELLDDWNTRIGMGQDVNIEIPYAQAEIAKRDKRIKELEQQIARLKTVPMKYRRMEFNAQLQRENTEQAAEISRLKALVGKCKDGIEGALSDDLPYINECKEALASIKEIDHAT